MWCVVHVLTGFYMYYPSLNKLWKTFKKVLKTSPFAFFTIIKLLSRRSSQKKTNTKSMRSIRSSVMGICLLLRVRGWKIDHQERKNANPLGYACWVTRKPVFSILIDYHFLLMFLLKSKKKQVYVYVPVNFFSQYTAINIKSLN